MVNLYAKYGWKSEKKASDASKNQKIEFSNSLNAMLQDFPEIKVDCIIVKKENVQPHITADPNKLYNYMCRLVVVDHVQDEEKFDFIPDKRTIKVESGNSLSDYLQTVLWFENRTKTTLINKPGESHADYNLQFADWIAHCIWAHYENAENDVFAIIGRKIKIRQLYF